MCRNPVTFLQILQQSQEADDLGFGVRFGACIVEFDADRRRVEIGVAAPVRRSRVPGALAFVDELIKHAVASDQVVSADPAAWIGEGPQGAFDVAVRGVVDDHEIRPTGVVVWRGYGKCTLRGTRRNPATSGQEGASGSEKRSIQQTRHHRSGRGERRIGCRWRRDRSTGSAGFMAAFYLLRAVDCPRVLFDCGTCQAWSSFRIFGWLRRAVTSAGCFFRSSISWAATMCSCPIVAFLDFPLEATWRMVTAAEATREPLANPLVATRW